MKKNELALRAFVREKLQSTFGIEADETVLRAIAAIVTLEEGNPIESEEVRSIKITEDTDGKITSKSTKLYNLMKISNYDLMGLVLKEFGILLSGDGKIQLALAVLTLIHEFYPKLKIDFNEQDSKILLSIYELGQQEFLATELIANFQARFSQPLTEDQANRSLSYFKELKVVKYLGAGKYKTRESMVYERN